MRRILGVAICGIFLLGVGGAFATPPGPGQCFNAATYPASCDTSVSSPAGPECAADDRGCVPDTPDHLKCSDAIVKAFDKAIGCVIKCHCKQPTNLLTGKPFNKQRARAIPPKNTRLTSPMTTGCQGFRSIL